MKKVLSSLCVSVLFLFVSKFSVWNLLFSPKLASENPDGQKRRNHSLSLFSVAHKIEQKPPKSKGNNNQNGIHNTRTNKQASKQASKQTSKQANKMTYLENKTSNRFWNCKVYGSTVQTSYGTLGTNGRTVTRTFDSARDARSHQHKQTKTKRQIGNYHEISKKKQEKKNQLITSKSPIKKFRPSPTKASQNNKSPTKQRYNLRSVIASRRLTRSVKRTLDF